MNEGILKPQKMMIVIFVQFTVQQIEYRNLHHTLVEIGSPILDNFDCHDLLGLQVLTFYNLTESALPKDVEYKVPVLVSILFVSKDVINEQNVVTIFIIVSIILDPFTGLGKHSSWVA